MSKGHRLTRQSLANGGERVKSPQKAVESVGALEGIMGLNAWHIWSAFSTGNRPERFPVKNIEGEKQAKRKTSGGHAFVSSSAVDTLSVALSATSINGSGSLVSSFRTGMIAILPT
jgi:hypothetical protein